MDETLYFYGEPGGKASGPLGIGSIEIAVKTGRLKGDVMLSRDGGEPWRSLGDVKTSGHDAFHANYDQAKAKAADEQSAREVQHLRERVQPTPINPASVAGVIQIIAILSTGLVFFLLVGAIICVSNGDSSAAKTFFYLGLTNLFSGLMLSAASEILRRLKEIATILSRGR